MGGALRVRIFGDLRVDGIDLTALRSRKARSLVKRLAIDVGSVVSVDALVDALWPDALPADPARDLSALVSRARAVVGADRIERRDRGYVLLAEWCDMAEVRLLVREARRRQVAGDGMGARAAAEAALALSAEPMLADEADADWVVSARSEMAGCVAEAHAVAAAAALDGGQIGDAAAHARAALAHDPFDEVALRLLMRAHAAAGRPASALAAYAETRERLAEELGVSPTRETEDLHGAILRGETVADVGAAQRAPLTSAGTGRGALPGRAREVALLDELLARSLTRAEVVVVEGEAGVGKTCLVDTWATAARARGVLVLGARVDDGPGLALQPVLVALAAQVPHDVDADATTATTSWSGVPGPAATSLAMQRAVFAELAATLRSATPPAGLALWIDDVHLADPVTIEWLAHVVREPRASPMLVVATKRAEEDVTIPRSATIAIGPLDLAAVAEIVGEERAPSMWRRTGGNALLVVELAAMESPDVGTSIDIDESNDESIEATGTAAGASRTAVPTAIRRAVAERLRRAGASAMTVRTAAVLGPVVDLDLLSGVLGASPLEVLADLDDATRRGFLEESDGQMVFRHELVRAAAEAEATAARRAWVHRTAATLLAARADVNPLELARHARAGGDLATAAAALADAADVARARFDLPGAERLLDAAVTAHDDADLRLRRSRLRLARNDLEGADLDAAAALGLGAAAQALELRAWVARNRHDMESAIRLGTAGAVMAERAGFAREGPGTDDATTAASCLVAVALAHRGLGELAEADALMERAAALQPSGALGLDAWRGVLRVHQGRPADALALLEPMVGAEAGGLLSFWVEHVLQMLAHAYGLVGRAGDALAFLDRFDAELERRGSAVRYAGAASTYRSWILRNLAVDDAEDEARRAFELAMTAEVAAQSQLDLADTLLARGSFDEAGALLDAAMAGSATRWFHNRWRFEQRAGVVRARLLLANGLSADALEIATATAGAAQARGDARYTTIARLIAARAQARLGHALDTARIERDLDALPRVAALEAWWMAADVADDTGLAQAAALAERATARLVPDAGRHADALRTAASARLRGRGSRA